MPVKKQRLEPYMKQLTGSGLRKEYNKTVYCHHVYLTYTQSISWKMLGWMSYKLESRLPGETSITSDVGMLLLLLSRFSRAWLLCNPIDGSPPGSSVLGILQARILERVVISFSNAWKHAKLLQSCLTLTPWTAAHQAPLSTGFSRQEYWSGFAFPSSVWEWYYSNGRKERGTKEPLD